MTSEEALFEEFGKQLIERVRDREIRYIDMFLEQKAPASKKYKDELDTLSPEQLEMIKEQAVQWVDGVIHDFLYLLEDSDLIKLRLERDDIVIEDIRRVAGADIQAYIFIWAEKYTTTRLTDYTKSIY